MNEQQAQKARATAFSKANEAVKPLREPLAKARSASEEAIAMADCLGAEYTRVWHTTFNKSLKDEEWETP